MYLKNIEVIGFKSFAEKTKLEFGPGISIIVGPNGCGKSNVSDAIKWVLGEQSAKSLRSKQMVDVIFNGTQNRPPLGMAEVSLIFDNAQNVLPIDFSEVVITRKIFRSGECEYFINNSPCRLKDIRDLFADTGIGADGYSIIEQGRVEFIIGSKSEEKRELLEEAAGISRYKFRKEESLRKIERVQQDISRINVLLSFHHEQVKALESAARKSKQYQKLKDELLRAEITQIIHRIDENRRKIDELQKELCPLVDEKHKNIASIDGLLASAERIKAWAIDADNKIITLQDEISRISSKIEIADSKIEQSEAMIKIAEEKIKSRTEEMERGFAEISALEESLKGLSGKLSDSELAASKIIERCELDSSDYEVVAKRYSEIYSCREEERNRIWSSFLPRLTEKTNLKARLESDLQHLDADANRLNSEINDNLNEIKNLEEEISKKSSEESEIKNQKGALDISFSASISKLKETEAKAEELRNRIFQLKQTISLLEGELKAFAQFETTDPVLSSIRTVLSEFPHIKGPVMDLIKIKQGFEKVVSALLGEKAYYIIAQTESDALAAINLLSEKELGGLTFVVDEKIEHFTKNKKVDEMMEIPAECSKAINYLLSSVRLDGEVVYDGVLIRGGKIASVQAEVIVKKKENESALKSEMKIFENSKEEFDIVISENEALKKELKTAEDLKNDKDFALRWYEKEISQMRGLLREKINLQNLISEEFSQTKADMEKIAKTISDTTKEIEELEIREKASRDKVAALDEEIEKIRPEEERKKKKIDDIKAELMKINPQIESLKNNIQLVDSKITFLKNSIENNASEIENWKKETEIHRGTNSENIELIKRCQTEKTQMQSHLEEILKERDSKNSELAALEANIQKFALEKESLLEKIHHLELEIKTYNVEISAHLSRLADEFEVNEEVARHRLSESLLDAEELSKLRKKIELLGSVNLAAPEEYDALNKKYEFILQQKNDLENAKADLEEIIAKINQTTKQQFSETWEKVRENFQNIFTKLFEGGQADLILTDKENILESGVEIIAQPPGKKLQNINLLSGGEKSLTAVALLFAIYLVRPSPFCLLDEVDAPLDESNVERFLNLLETFTEKSQFLMITHNKRTMLRADVIYGVTMEEFGVSKIISMKFEKPPADLSSPVAV